MFEVYNRNSCYTVRVEYVSVYALPIRISNLLSHFSNTDLVSNNKLMNINFQIYNNKDDQFADLILLDSYLSKKINDLKYVVVNNFT